MRFTLITQVALITISLIIVFAYLKPSFLELREKQDELFVYEDTVAKAEEYNNAIQQLIEKSNSFSSSDLEQLNTFIPSTIDSLKVMRDIESIFTAAKQPLLSLIPKEVVTPQSGDVIVEAQIVNSDPVMTNTSYQDFEVSFVGTYEDLKKTIELTERNETLLELMSLSFEPLNSEVSDANLEVIDTTGLFKYVITLRTFGLAG